MAQPIKERLEYLRSQIRAECISQGEVLELQGLAEHIESGDVELLQWAGVPEFPEEGEPFEVTVRVTVTAGREIDGGYDGDPSPDAVRAWLAPWIAEQVTHNAPYGITAEA